jgi:hypothetical protein
LSHTRRMGTCSNPQHARHIHIHPPQRLKGSIRRCDVRAADDYDEGEYREATSTLGAVALDVVKVCVCV